MGNYPKLKQKVVSYMILTRDNCKCFYDSKYDDLTISLKNDTPVYSDEVYNNIYLIRSSKDDSVVGTQILYLKKAKRSRKILKEYLPCYIYNIVIDLEVC